MIMFFPFQVLMFLFSNAITIFLIAWLYVGLRRIGTRRQVFTLHLRACARLQLPLDGALENYRGTPGEIRSMLKHTYRELTSGATLSQALGYHWACLPSWYVQMIEIGERHGNLADMLDRISLIDNREEELRMNLVERIFYPVLLCLFVSQMGGFVYFFIMPRFQSMFTDMGLPNGSLDVMWLSSTAMLAANAIAVVLALLVLVTIPMPWGANLERPLFLLFRLKYFLRQFMPYVGRQYLQGACGRWATTTGMLLDAGMDLPGAVREASCIESDPYFRDHAEEWSLRIADGQSLSAAVSPSRFVPRSMVWQVQVAEGSAALPQTLRTSGEQVVRNLQQRFAIFLRLAMPLVVLLVGYAVAAMCVGLFRPLVTTIYMMLE